MALLSTSIIISILAVSVHSQPTTPATSSLRQTKLSTLNIINTTAPSLLATDCIPSSTKYPWWHMNGVWYTAIRESKTWYQAEKICREIEPGKTNMATIKTATEQETLTNAQKWLGTSVVWISALKVEETSNFYWYTNNETMVKLETMPVTYWASGQPDDVSRKHICVYMDKGENGHWHDVISCANAYPAFCEHRC